MLNALLLRGHRGEEEVRYDLEIEGVWHPGTTLKPLPVKPRTHCQ
jgi:hypothetical protein